jgi:hypothetical protein
MKFAIGISLFIALLPSGSAVAQDSDLYHPFLSDRFNLGVGAFWPSKELTLRVDGSAPEEEIDFDEMLRLDDYERTGSAVFRWRFGQKWSFWGQYWSLEDRGGAVLDEDTEWEDVIFKQGTFVNGGMDTTVARLFFGRTITSGTQFEFGLGAGFHWLELGAFLEGQALTDGGDTEFQRESVSADFPLPNIGVWYHYSWSPNWIFQTRVDWLSASVGNYSGGLWNVQAGVNGSFFRNFGIALHYNAFVLDVDVDKSDWHGKAESVQHGPFLALTATW